MSKKNPTKIYGLVGYPVKHSFSPAMHNAAFRALEINAEYRLFEVRPEELEAFLGGDIIVKDIDGNEINQKDIAGLNVTIPHKEKILDFVLLDLKSFYLREIKAVNTIVKKEGKWKGFNTDIPGFSKDLKEKGIELADKKIAILGAGGAGRAVAYVIAKSKAEEISIYDIDKVKSNNVVQLITDLSPGFKINAVDNIEQLNIINKDLLINATPVGLNDNDPCLVSQDDLHEGLFVYDLIYNPPETKLLKIAKQKGARTFNGLGMLLYQGILSFKIWTDINPPQKIMQEALERELKKCTRQ